MVQKLVKVSNAHVKQMRIYIETIGFDAFFL